MAPRRRSRSQRALPGAHRRSVAPPRPRRRSPAPPTRRPPASDPAAGSVGAQQRLNRRGSSPHADRGQRTRVLRRDLGRQPVEVVCVARETPIRTQKPAAANRARCHQRPPSCATTAGSAPASDTVPSATAVSSEPVSGSSRPNMAAARPTTAGVTGALCQRWVLSQAAPRPAPAAFAARGSQDAPRAARAGLLGREEPIRQRLEKRRRGASSGSRCRHSGPGSS